VRSHFACHGLFVWATEKALNVYRQSPKYWKDLKTFDRNLFFFDTVLERTNLSELAWHGIAVGTRIYGPQAVSLSQNSGRVAF
jgi:hypothetical protein